VAAGNRIELWGRIRGAPELRVTPSGTSVLRVSIDTGNQLVLPVVMTGEDAARIGAGLKADSDARVKGVLKIVRGRTKSGLANVAYEVLAESIEIEQRP
jgi:primosomal replication protein N